MTTPDLEDIRGRLRAVIDDARVAGVDPAVVADILTEVAAQARAASGVDDRRPPSASAAGGEPGAEAARHPERTAKVGPVTLFNEMGKLEEAGRRGWRVVGSGTAMHLVTPTAEQWEYRRVFASRATGRALEADGWQRFSSGWFPWGYYQRPTGRPAEEEPVVGGYLVEP